jgi:undecaprenyl diphosphate synthase
MSNNLDSLNGIPQHVCIIMDGNGRWAKKRFMPRTVGHKKGVEITRRSIEFFARSKVRHLTLFAFSSENWNRPADEVGTLMDLFLRSLRENINELHEKNIRIRFIGDRSAFSSALQDQIGRSEDLTAGNSHMTLNIAANYGGQWDISQSVTRLALMTAEDQMDNSSVSSDDIAANLTLADTPDPDLFIRTGGERRISNFLLWQLAYTELYFTDVLWPDFDEGEMQIALDDYQGRQRRWGKTGEQLEGLVPC